MIIWGWRVRKKTIGTGVFFCPGEGGDRNYEHKQARRWFTIFFIPLIPLKELGDFIECTSCENTYYPDVLKGKTASEIEDISTIAIRHVAVSMALADGTVDPRERDAAVTVVQRFASHPYDLDDLDSDLSSLQVSALSDNLEELGAVLNEHGKENVLTAAVFLAGADGHVDRSEMEVARQIGKALTMSSAHIEGTIQQELSRLGLSL
ncbi:MAG: TerB family tellurite resistance protein [Acidimicrobiaceae bacterium]|nr:TerB family tellurite resistance protein [Acidimicrobiaceae bacterium]MDB4103737.1 TerB family tellurite resistance protein [Acidimicrobiales bacterium]